MGRKLGTKDTKTSQLEKYFLEEEAVRNHLEKGFSRNVDGFVNSVQHVNLSRESPQMERIEGQSVSLRVINIIERKMIRVFGLQEN